MNELEAIVWCKRCLADKYEVWRVQVGESDVFEHVTVPPNITVKHCECGQLLERKL